jgi:alpha-tubulin suppressor-like RCC1 family protein
MSGVWAWGNGSGGRLGTGDNSDRFDPVLVPRIRGKIILSVAAGHWHSMAIVAYPPMMGGGWLYSWGSGYHGQLAQGLKVVSAYAEPVDYFGQFHILIKDVACGSHHCAALTREGELYTWGQNLNGCLGR